MEWRFSSEVRIHSLFPTPLFESYLHVEQNWIDKVVELEYNHTGLNWISTNRNLWEVIPDLKSQIQIHVEHYARGILKVSDNVEIDLVRSWAVKHKPGDTAKQHCHTNAVWSGVYYLSVPKHSGDIVFDKGVSHQNCFLPTLEPDVNFFNDFTQRLWKFTPGSGTLLLFPSQLLHHVEKNESDMERYCIGFDVFIRGTFGTDYGSRVTIS